MGITKRLFTQHQIETDLRNQLEGKTQAFETLQKAHDSLVDQFQESRRAEGALATALRTHNYHHETCHRYRWGTVHTKESDCDCGIYAALKLTDL